MLTNPPGPEEEAPAVSRQDRSRDFRIDSRRNSNKTMQIIIYFEEMQLSTPQITKVDFRAFAKARLSWRK